MDNRQPLLGGSRRALASRGTPGHFRRLRTTGHSLLELSFTLGISAVILMTLYGFLMTQAMVSLEESTELSTQNSTRVGAQQLIDELEMCKPKRLDTMGAWFEYYLPKTGPNGGYEMDSSGNLIYGVSDNGVWYPKGFYCVTFVRSNEPEDFLSEVDLHFNTTGLGTDLDGNNSYTDIYIGGSLVILAYDSNGMPVGGKRFLSGRFFMQLDPVVPTGTPPVVNIALNYEPVDSVNLNVFATMGNGDPAVIAQLKSDKLKYKGPGIFMIRHTNGIGAQKADPFVDYNSNGILDNSESYTDANLNGRYDESDCEAFTDTNGNNVRDTLEAYVDGNHNSKFDCRMCLQLITFNPGRKVTESGLDRDKSMGLRVIRTKIRFKNL